MGQNTATFEILNDYFKKLDSVKMSQTEMFTSEDDKERYETYFMYAFRKYQAAIYHFENVKDFLKVDEEKLQKLLSYGSEEIQASKVVMKVSSSEDQYAYELSAFLEALKSSVDFLAIASSPHLHGIEANGIKTLIRLVTIRGKMGPIFDEVKRNLEWLESLRSYRHHVVHRRIISTSIGYEKHIIEGITKTVVYPVIIPKSPPHYIPDTRKSRAMEDGPLGFDSSWGEVRVKSSDGEEEILDYSFEYFPPNDFIAIEDFMEVHLKLYENFFTEIIQVLSSLEFKTLL